MELRHLRYFVTVAECLHFGQAANKLHIAQPSLSQQIQQLEAELQTTLLSRTHQRVELTEAGRIFLDEAREILAHTDRAAVITRRTGRGESIRLKVGIGYCMNHGHMGRIVSHFNSSHPEVYVELQTMSVGAQTLAVREGRLDVGFMRPPLSDRALESEALGSEPFVAAVPATHPLAMSGIIPLAALADDGFILPPRAIVPMYHDLVLRACREAGFIPHTPHEADHLVLMLALVAAGVGVALIPASAAASRPRRVSILSLTAMHVVIETIVTWRRNHPAPFVTDFVSAAHEVTTPRRSRTA